MTEDFFDRLDKYMNYSYLNDNQLTVKAGLSIGALGKQRKGSRGLSNDSIAKILYSCEDLNADWLMTGRGEMINKKNSNLNGNLNGNLTKEKEEIHAVLQESSQHYGKEGKGIPLIPVEAMAGYANGDIQVMDYELEESIYRIPDFDDKGVKFLIRASGSSMYPKYSNGDLLACRPINDLSFFQWGKVYVLDTDQGPLVKRLFPCKEDDAYLECHSENKERYPVFILPKASVRKVSIVVGVIRLE